MAHPNAGFDHNRALHEELLRRMEACLAKTPNEVELQVERAHLLAELDRPKEAAQAYHLATRARTPRYPFTIRAYSILPFKGDTLPITALLLVAPEWGNSPFRKHLDDQTFLTLQVIADFHNPGVALPPHQLVINCISDADSCQNSLKAATVLLEQTTAPLINAPSIIFATNRETNAARLASIPGVKAPKFATFPREFFAGTDVAAALKERGFSFPLLLRAPGYHTGLHFVRLETPQEITAALSTLPGDTVSVIEFLGARSADGQIRKYRVMMIDGQPYPAHLAISQNWKVHYFSADMADSPPYRAEDEAFLRNMPQALGAHVMETLKRIHEVMRLDYYGIDFSIDRDGDILLFEANATMDVQPPAEDAIWSYRRKPVQQIADATRAMFFTKAFGGRSGSTNSPAQILSEFTLRQIEESLARSPDSVELKMQRARVLVGMELFDEAKDVYLDILAKDPTQLVALNNLGIVLKANGNHEAALKVHREIANIIPSNAKARVNLAHSLREAGELEDARGHYEAALRISPDLPEAHEGYGHVLMYLGEPEAAWKHRRTALKNHPPLAFAWNEKNLPRVLVLTSPCGGNSPITRLLEKKSYATLNLVTDFYEPSVPLPDHDLVLNAVGDADYCGSSLRAAQRVLEHTTKPIINLPSRVEKTGRSENASMLGALEGVIAPRISTLSREILTGPNASSILEEKGFTFPLLLRTPGFHGGGHFLRVENPDGFAAAVAQLPGKNLMAIEYLDARDDDGKIRKYRVMLIDGKLYPLHKAISQAWMIHYFSAEMTRSAEHRGEDKAFLENMDGVLGRRVIRALERVRDALDLDYGGIDFSVNRNGDVLLFEANATMAVPPPDKGEIWDYRRGPVQRIHTAVREMILARVAKDA
jgi:tetratricopeptide (TPR) repeat protein